MVENRGRKQEKRELFQNGFHSLMKKTKTFFLNGKGTTFRFSTSTFLPPKIVMKKHINNISISSSFVSIIYITFISNLKIVVPSSVNHIRFIIYITFRLNI